MNKIVVCDKGGEFMVSRKTVAILLTLTLLIFSMTACGAQSQYVGKWVCHTIEEDGYDIPAEDAGITIEITFSEDGTYTEILNSYEGEGEWSESEDGITIVRAGIEYPMTLGEDGTLAAVNGEMTMIYEKETESN